MRKFSVFAKRRIVPLFAFGFLACGPQQQAAWEALPRNPTSTASSPVPGPTGSAAPKALVQAGDDPKTCVDQIEAAERAWRESVERKLDEKLPSLQRCATAGKLKREERLYLRTTFSPSGAWQPPTVAQTTLADCRVIACVEKELSQTKVDAWPGEKTPRVAFDFFLSPSSPPRKERVSGPTFPNQDVTRCIGEVPQSAVFGRLAPEVIQKVVRSHYSEYRACYEEGLSRNRNLKGRLTMRFVIEHDGSVSDTSISDLTLPDCKVARCVRDAYPKMKFPPPEGGIVTVVYPLVLEPAPE